MGNHKYRQYRFVVVLALILSFGYVGEVHAGTTQSSSTHYSISEVQLGGNGSAQHDCSGSYCAQESAGSTTVGSASSNNYSAQLGSDSTNTPLLEVAVNGGNQNLGTLDPSTTATATFSIKVRSYLDSGYAVYVTGSAPSQGTHTLKTLDTSCPCTSQPGTEQFGINLTANSTPSVGAVPVEVPSSAYSFGAAYSDYNQANLFKYHDGDAVAGSATSSGETDYTLSMIVNISNVTPGGHYTSNLSAVVVPTY